MIALCVEIIGVSYGTLNIAVTRYSDVASIILKRVSLQSVETGSSHLNQSRIHKELFHL